MSLLTLRKLHMFIGSSSSGKSYLLKSIVSDHLSAKRLKFGIVFTATKHNCGYDWLPDQYVFSNYDQEILNRYIAFLVKMKKKGTIPNSFVILDDIVMSINQHSKAFAEFLSTYRHYNITLYVTTQSINKCVPLFREQADYAYIFQLHTVAAIKAAYESYGQLFLTIKKWQEFLKEGTCIDYQCIVWSKETKPVIELKYKRFKAPAATKLRTFKF